MEYTLISVKSQFKCKSKFDNDSYLLKLELSNGKQLIILSCFNNFIPFKNDIIENNFISVSNTLYETKKLLINLPTGVKQQKLRIIELLKSKENIENFNKFGVEYGSSFWYEVWIKLKEFISNEDNNIPYIDDLYNHIKNYYVSQIYYFQKKLKDNGLELGYVLCEQLYCHKLFGPTTEVWKVKDIKELFDISGFKLSDILNIADFLKATTIEKSKLIIIYSLENNNNGNCYINYNFNDWLQDYISSSNESNTCEDEIDNINEELFNNIITELINENVIYNIDNKIYSCKIFEKEKLISMVLLELSKTSVLNDFSNETIILSNGIEYNEQQINAINNIFKNDFIMIDGKAGTGKSTIVPGIIYSINKYIPEKDIFIITPTAKAKMRICEILKNYTELGKVKMSISTIHSFLAKNNLGQVEYSVNNIIIIDEFSMVDVNIFYSLLSLINTLSKNQNFKLIVMGDIRQLPSISIGDVFNRIKICKEYSKFNYNELTEIIRNTDELLVSVDDILNLSLPRVNKSFKFIEIDTFKNINIEALILKNYNMDDSMIITMTNQSVDKNTKIIRNILNPLSKIVNKIKEIDFNYNIYRINDPIVFTKNFNNEGLYNGMTGIIKNIELLKDNYNYRIIVLFNNGIEFKFDTKEKNDNKLKYLKPSYIITVHKAQGQEYDNVYVLIDNVRMANINLLYTAITRGKKKVTIISTKSLLKKCINTSCVRNSLLDYMILFKVLYSDLHYNKINKDNDNLIKNEYIDNFKKYYNFISNHDEIIYKKNTYQIDNLCNLLVDNNIVGKYDIINNKVKLY
jgi:exodeoxyribonuclease V alpha subunit